MRRSPHLRFLPLVLAAVAAAAALAAPAAALGADAPASWSPRLAYVLTTGETREALSKQLALTEAQDTALREIGGDLYRAQKAIQRRSDLIVMNGGLSDAEKTRLIAAVGYNGDLYAAETSAAARVEREAGVAPDALVPAVESVWQTDAAVRKLDTELRKLGVTPQAMTGSFRVYGTRFTDEYGTAYGVAVPDKFAKFASQGYANSGATARPAGYPDGSYAVALYWDGVHHTRDGGEGATFTTPHYVPAAKVVDVGPWNQDDNWWNSYSDPQRPRRINNAGISGNGGLVGLPQLAQGLPEAQAAYFNYYGRPDPIPAYKSSPLNYWDKPRGSGGQWSGADQFGRQVVSPAAIDLTPPVAHDLGMSRDTDADGDDDYYDNEWIDVVPLWEARLGLVGGVKVTAGPYITGQRVSFTYTVQNLGSLTGTWDSFTFTLTRPSGGYRDPALQGPISLRPGEQRTLTFQMILDDAGTVTGFPQAQRAGTWTHVGTETVTLADVKQRTVDRAEGPTRFETAVAMSKAAYANGAKSVVVATAFNFPDALSGSALAYAEDGPLLLVGPTMPAAVDAEIRRLAPARIVVLGSDKAVSEAVAQRVAAAAPSATLVRIGGHNRYATARLVAAELAKHTGGKAANGTAIVATGRDFPDALGASVLSARKGWPILLTETSYVPSDTVAGLQALGVTQTYVIGSEKVVTAAAAAALPNPTRVAGATRYDTAAAVADLGEANGLSYVYTGLALGTMFPDALAGGVLAARNGGSMLLTARDSLPPAASARLKDNRTVTTHLHVYGSSAAVSEGTVRQAKEALR